MYSNRPLDEIAVSPSIYRGVSVTELLGLLLFTMIETIWLVGFIFKAFPYSGSVVFSIFGGLAYAIVRVYKRAKAFGDLKKELPGALAYLYLNRKLELYMNLPIIWASCICLFVFLVLLPAILSNFGMAGLSIGPAFHFTLAIIRRLAKNNAAFRTPIKKSVQKEVITRDTVFDTK
ncbi:MULTISPECIES: hypothetical protein [Vibrio]|uniref:hypothetical protein n=1 Tax=Vibrio TaxID=662 RepID=UPI001E2EA479|nr:hypothetical protein [Vibrio lentus]MCC4837969.1 hypothetical protein [Vibrio lentus]